MVIKRVFTPLPSEIDTFPHNTASCHIYTPNTPSVKVDQLKHKLKRY
jgi:hypothetical protein